MMIGKKSYTFNHVSEQSGIRHRDVEMFIANAARMLNPPGTGQTEEITRWYKKVNGLTLVQDNRIRQFAADGRLRSQVNTPTGEWPDISGVAAN